MLEKYSLPVFIIKNDIRTETGAPWNFKNHAYMYDFLVDRSKNICCIKSAQIGFSVSSTVKALWTMKHSKLDGAIVMPTFNDMSDYTSGKINRIITQNAVFNEWVNEKDSMTQKRIGDSLLYLRGASTERSALSITLDLVIFDEIDRAIYPTIFEQYESRLQHSSNPNRWVFSNPSTPGNGVDRYWQKSDQKHWFIKPACNHEHYMNFPESFDMENRKYVCKVCKGEVTDKDRMNGRWIKKYKDREWSGYWIPLFIAPYITAEYVLELYKTKGIEYFYNFVLGLPYASPGTRVSISDIERNLTTEVNTQEGRIIIGVDTGGDGLWVTIGNEQGVFYNGLLKTYKELEQLMRRWERSVVVIDQGGDLIGPRQLRENYPGRVFLCYFRQDTKHNEMINYKDDGSVIVDRERMITLCVEEIVDNRIKFHGTLDDWYDFATEWQNLYRREEADDLGIKKVKWAKSGKSDYPFSFLYFRVGMSRFNHNKADISTSIEVFAKTGPTISIEDTVVDYRVQATLDRLKE